MYEFLAHPITLLCLGTIFILVALLFFYFKRTFALLEHAQMEQARILQHFITNIEMSKLQSQQRGASLPSTNQDPNQPLINVSDDEKSHDDSDDDSDEESDDESNDTNSIIDIQASEELESSEKEIKVIHLENSHLEEVNDLEIQELEKSDDDDDDDDDVDDDDDDDDESGDNEEQNVEELPETLESVNLDKLESIDIPVDYKNMNVNALKSLAKDKGLLSDGDKKTKKELIKLLEEHK